jgi:hypothetical protein
MAGSEFFVAVLAIATLIGIVFAIIDWAFEQRGRSGPRTRWEHHELPKRDDGTDQTHL